jgi:hypothetical protein
MASLNIDEKVKENLLKALNRHKKNQRKAAEILGVSSRTITRLKKRFDIVRCPVTWEYRSLKESIPTLDEGLKLQREAYDKEMELISEVSEFASTTLWQIHHESNRAEGIESVAWLARFAALKESLDVLAERACVNANAAFNKHQNSKN